MEWSGYFGMGSTYNEDRHAGAARMMSFRAHQFDVMTIKCLTRRRERRGRVRVQYCIDHGCPHSLDAKAAIIIRVIAIRRLADEAPLHQSRQLHPVPSSMDIVLVVLTMI